MPSKRSRANVIHRDFIPGTPRDFDEDSLKIIEVMIRDALEAFSFSRLVRRGQAPGGFREHLIELFDRAADVAEEKGEPGRELLERECRSLWRRDLHGIATAE